MKKLISTVTALTFVMGLTAAGFAQTAAKEADKPAVKMETKTGQSQVAPQSKEKAAEPAAKTVTVEPKKAEEPKKPIAAEPKKEEKKGAEKSVKSKRIKKAEAKAEKTEVTPAAEPKKEEKK